jgi:hypothetical protein
MSRATPMAVFSPVALALLLVLAATPAFAESEHDKQAAALYLGCLTVVPLALFPLGLSFLLLFRALAPRRARLLVLQAESGRIRTFVVGFLNVVVLGLLAVAGQHFHPPFAGVLAVLTCALLVFLGSYGLAGGLGMRITGAVTVDVKELALGWFVLCYVGCFPIVGWCLACYGACRAIGAGLLALVAREDLNDPVPSAGA